MARRKDPDSASSQFFICLSRENFEQLDGQYTAFGRVVEGFDLVKKIEALGSRDGATKKPIEIRDSGELK